MSNIWGSYQSLAKEEQEQLEQAQRPEKTATISWETELDERYGLARRQNLNRAASVRIVPSTTRASAEEAAEQLNRQFAGKSAAKKTGGRTYNMLSEEERTQFYKSAEFKESGLTEKEADDLITAYAGQERASTAARVLLLDALLFSKTVRRSRKGKGGIPPEEIMADTMTQGPADRTYNLLSKEERKEFYRSEEFKGSGIQEKTAEKFILEHARALSSEIKMNGSLAIDATSFARAASEALEAGVQTETQIVRKALEQAVAEEDEATVEPFKAWRPQPDGASTPKPVAAVRAEDAVQVRKSLLAKKDAKRNKEAEKSIRNSILQTQQNAETVENSPMAIDRTLKRAETPSQELTAERQSMRKPFHDNQQDIETSENPFSEFNEMERADSFSQRVTEQQKDREFVNNSRQSEREFLQSSLQNAGTYENSFLEAGETTEHAEIPSRQQLPGHKNTQERHYSDRQNTVASENSFPVYGGVMEQSETSFSVPDEMTEHAGIPPRQPTERQNTRGFPSQDWQAVETQVNPSSRTLQDAEIQMNPSSQTQQITETYRNPSLRTQQTARTSENTPLAEKRTGAPAGNHDTITVAQHGQDEQEMQDAEARRMEKLNAAYEHDRAALAKTDPAFARSTFRDVGHAEGSEETDSHAIRKILDMKKSNLMTDLGKDKEKGL